MKAYTICLWFFIFNCALALVGEIQPFTIMSGGEAVSIYTDPDILASTSTFTNQTIEGLGDIQFLGLLLTMAHVLFNSTVGIPLMLASLGVPMILIPILTLPAWYCYFAAILQLATGRILPLFE